MLRYRIVVPVSGLKSTFSGGASTVETAQAALAAAVQAAGGRIDDTALPEQLSQWASSPWYRPAHPIHVATGLNRERADTLVEELRERGLDGRRLLDVPIAFELRYARYAPWRFAAVTALMWMGAVVAFFLSPFAATRTAAQGLLLAGAAQLVAAEGLGVVAWLGNAPIADFSPRTRTEFEKTDPILGDERRLSLVRATSAVFSGSGWAPFFRVSVATRPDGAGATIECKIGAPTIAATIFGSLALAAAAFAVLVFPSAWPLAPFALLVVPVSYLDVRDRFQRVRIDDAFVSGEQSRRSLLRTTSRWEIPRTEIEAVVLEQEKRPEAGRISLSVDGRETEQPVFDMELRDVQRAELAHFLAEQLGVPLR